MISSTFSTTFTLTYRYKICRFYYYNNYYFYYYYYYYYYCCCCCCCFFNYFYYNCYYFYFYNFFNLNKLLLNSYYILAFFNISEEDSALYRWLNVYLQGLRNKAEIFPLSQRIEMSDVKTV